jgi:uncharacterized membrane protein
MTRFARIHRAFGPLVREAFTPASLRALGLLGVAGASIVLLVQQVFDPGRMRFVSENHIAFRLRLKLLLAIGVASAVAVLLGAVCAWFLGGARLRRGAHLIAPVVALAFLPPLCLPDAWSNPLSGALAISALVLLAERLFRMSFDAAAGLEAPRFFQALRGFSQGAAARFVSRCAPYAPLAAVIAGVLGYATYMSVETLWMHGRFQTFGYDLGQYDNVFFSTLHGHPLRDAPLGLTADWSELRNHADLTTFFLLPFYAIHPGAPALLVIQSCVIALGAIPLYRFGVRRLSRGSAAAVALAYLFYAPLHGMQFYDFHFQPIASTFVLFVIDFADERRWLPCAIAFAAAAGCREDVPIGLAILGVFLALSGYRPRAGVVMAAVATAYFVLMRVVIMPRIPATSLNTTPVGQGTFLWIYKDLIPGDARNFAGLVATLVTNPAYVFSTLLTPEKLRYSLQILAPVAFLPLRRGYLALSLLHGFILTLLTTEYSPTIEIGFQYSANFVPYIFPAAVLALEKLGQAPRGPAHRRAALASMILGTALCAVFWGAFPPRKSIHGGFNQMAMTRPTAAEITKHADLQELHRMVPESASLAVSEAEMPHLSRFNMLSLRDTTDADYLLYGQGSHGSDKAEKALAAGEFEKAAERPGLILLKRKKPLGDAGAAPAH